MNKEERFVVRLYDGFDSEWMDVSEPVTREEAKRIWNEKTNGGKEKTTFDDIDYYRIFPADFIMRLSLEGRKLREEEMAIFPDQEKIK